MSCQPMESQERQQHETTVDLGWVLSNIKGMRVSSFLSWTGIRKLLASLYCTSFYRIWPRKSQLLGPGHRFSCSRSGSRGSGVPYRICTNQRLSQPLFSSKDEVSSMAM
ncbi:hypothetical protein RF11_16522 [Thelohanellus kitauei]|uniref:Uncharacterized protein n=1 Tax=Thelohanellus kitauei TaxID=669202 RepID=A0A0C2MFG2_THEKT|nr:hypothetical protein RF11_16522 [Thelohanellus kitauei]